MFLHHSLVPRANPFTYTFHIIRFSNLIHDRLSGFSSYCRFSLCTQRRFSIKYYFFDLLSSSKFLRLSPAPPPPPLFVKKVVFFSFLSYPSTAVRFLCFYILLLSDFGIVARDSAPDRRFHRLTAYNIVKNLFRGGNLFFFSRGRKMVKLITHSKLYDRTTVENVMKKNYD